MSDKEDTPKQLSKDKELDDLLDSAIDDFDKFKKEDKTETEDEPKELADLMPDELWNEEFLASQAKVFEEKMASLFGGNNGAAPPSSENITASLQRMAEAAAMALQPETENVADPQFTQSISDALKGLNVGQENLNNPFNPEEISRMFGGLDMNDQSQTGGNAFLPFMQGMMQSLLSAEVLLPSLKDLSEKYPKWLADNASKISLEDKQRYESQQKLMEQVCADLESERPSDSPEVKKERFHKVLEHMGKMQDLGQPPADLFGDINQIPALDPSALQDPSQCSLM